MPSGTDDAAAQARGGAPEGAAPLLRDDPRAIGPYTILGRLGAGGMGTVYLGRSEKGRRVAIKVIRPELAEDEAFVRRFHHEAAAARKVAGFCTARVLDDGLDVPRPYLVTEYVDGLRLDHAVERDGPLDSSSLEGFAVGVAAALTAIHSAGVIHRDLKPGNVLLSRFGPRVIDFGIARALDDTSMLTRVSSIMGTPGWMSPEQFEKRPATPATDVFAWGGLVAFAATGRQPYGEGPLATIAYRVMHEPVDLTGIEDDKLRRVVESALLKNPDARPTAREILLDLLGEEADGDTGEAVTTALQRTWSGPSPVAAAGRSAVTPVELPAAAGAAVPDPETPAPVEAAAAAAAVVSTTAVAATAAETRDAAAAGATEAAAAADPARTADADPPPATKPVEPARPAAERLLPAAGQPLPAARPARERPADRPGAGARKRDPNRPLPSAGLPMPERPARQPRQRQAPAPPAGPNQAAGMPPAPAWAQPGGPYAAPPAPDHSRSAALHAGQQPPYGHAPQPRTHPGRHGQERGAPASHPGHDPRAAYGRQGAPPPPQPQHRGQQPGWYPQAGTAVPTRHGGAAPPVPGAYPRQAEQVPGPTAGYRVRRWFAYLLAWCALLPAAFVYGNREQVAGDPLQTQNVAALLALLFGALTLAYLLLPASRQRRGRAVTARVIGLIGMALAVAAGGETLPTRHLTLFIESLGFPFVLLAVGFFLYPKDRQPSVER